MIKLSSINFKNDALRDVTSELLDEGYIVHAVDKPVVSWIIVSDDEGNYVSVEYLTYAPFDMRVAFPIEPNKESGAGFIIFDDTCDEHYGTTADKDKVIKFVKESLVPEKENWYDKKVYKNRGLESVTFSIEQIVK